MIDIRHQEHRATLAPLAQEHWDAVARVAYALLGDAPKAADAVASTFLRLRDDPGSFRQGPLRHALYRDLIDRILSAAPPPDGYRAQLHAAVARLDDLDRMAFILRSVERLPDSDAAATLRIPPDELRRRSGRLAVELTHQRLARKVARPRSIVYADPAAANR